MINLSSLRIQPPLIAFGHFLRLAKRRKRPGAIRGAGLYSQATPIYTVNTCALNTRSLEDLENSPKTSLQTTNILIGLGGAFLKRIHPSSFQTDADKLFANKKAKALWLCKAWYWASKKSECDVFCNVSHVVAKEYSQLFSLLQWPVTGRYNTGARVNKERASICIRRLPIHTI